jgi:hypothetical protein
VTVTVDGGALRIERTVSRIASPGSTRLQTPIVDF